MDRELVKRLRELEKGSGIFWSGSGLYAHYETFHYLYAISRG